MSSWFNGASERTKGFEGYSPKAKWDRKQWTNGYGTRARHEGEVIDEPEAQRRLDSELAGARNRVLRFDPSLDDGTAEALTDLTFNAGTKWMNSGLGRAVRNKNWSAARALFLQYDKADRGDGTLEPLKGLSRRRAQMVHLIGGNDAADDTNGLGDEMVSPSTPATPEQAAKKRTLINKALSEHLLQTRPTTGNWFEGLTSAIARGVGAYGIMDNQRADDDKRAALSAALRGANPDDPVLQAYGEADPGETLKLVLQDRKDRAADTRADARMKAQEDRADARNKATIDAERAKLDRQLAVESARYSYKESGEANDAKNWMQRQHGGYTIRENVRTGEMRVYRGGAEDKSKYVPPHTPNVVPLPGGMPAAPVSTTPPQLSPTQSAEPPATAQPVSDTGKEVLPAVTSAPQSAVVPDGLIDNGDGTVSDQLGYYKLKPALKDGTAAPGFLFRNRSLYTQAPDDRKAEYEAALVDNKELTKGIRAGHDQWRKMKPIVETTQEAVKSAAKTGYKGDFIQTLRSALSTVGFDVAQMTDAALIDAASNRFVPAVRAGLPGAVSNYEMQQYLKSVVNLGNTPEANYLLLHFMKKQGDVAETDKKLMAEFQRMKRETGQPDLLDDGFSEFVDDYYSKSPIISEQDKELIRLASSGVKLDKLVELAEGTVTPQRAVSKDGTLPKPEKSDQYEIIELDGKKYKAKIDPKTGQVVDAQEVE